MYEPQIAGKFNRCDNVLVGILVVSSLVSTGWRVPIGRRLKFGLGIEMKLPLFHHVVVVVVASSSILITHAHILLCPGFILLWFGTRTHCGGVRILAHETIEVDISGNWIAMRHTADILK